MYHFFNHENDTINYIPYEGIIINDYRMKKFWTSKTIWLALAQGVAGVMTALLVTDPTLSTVGWFALVKSGIDISLRFLTIRPIE